MQIKLPAVLRFALLLFCCVFGSIYGEEIIVHTFYGQLRGQIRTLPKNMGQIDTFFGIPFARAKRFEKPIPPQKWEGTQSASDQPPGCVPHARPSVGNGTANQPISEDCLYLNVFAPHRSSTDQNKTFPVLVVIHGGAFETGSSKDYKNYNVIGERFVTDTNARGIVFVSVQYRLGVIGFATTGDEELPGNFGIWDQIMALQYVKDNIKAFGGDPSRVTVYGYSAGSGSTALLSVCPKSRDLFQRAIRMSGSLLSASSSGTFVPNETKSLAKALGCAPDQTKKCLSEKSVEQIFDGMDQIGPASLSVNLAKFGPNRMDRELFPQDYPDLIATSPPKKMILGFNELDSLLFNLILDQNVSISMLALTDDQIARYDQKAFEAFVGEFVAKHKYFGDQSDAVKAHIVDFYVNKFMPSAVKDQTFYLLLYTTLLSDLMYAVPTLWEAQMRVNSNWPTYLYENVHFNPSLFPKRTKIHAAYHTFDHSLIFDDEFTKEYEEDRRVSDFLVTAIKNFVISGDPSTETVRWVPSPNFTLDSVERLQHLRLTAEKPGMAEGMAAEVRRARFWRELAQQFNSFDSVRSIFQSSGAPPANSAQFAQLIVFVGVVAVIIAIIGKSN